jgi:hypothetical protein
MTWAALFVGFFVSHQVGDFVLQTDWQATHKHGGLGRDPQARRALLAHILTYTCAYVPVSVWIASRLHWQTLVIVAVIAIPHLIQDDGRLIEAYMRSVKRLEPEQSPLVAILLDQAFHMVALLGAALLVTVLQ